MRLSILFAILISSCLSLAQNKETVKVKLESEFSDGLSGNLMRFQKLEYYCITIKSKKIKNLDFYLIAKNYDERGLTRTDTILNTHFFERTYFGNNSSEGKIFSFSIVTQNNKSDSVHFGFYFPRTNENKIFNKLPRDDYSFRDAILSNGKYLSLAKDSLYPILVYSLPYEDPKRPGYLFYCELTSQGFPPSQWGQKYGVKHCIVYELMVR